MNDKFETTLMTRVASLLADPARATMLWALIDGTSRPAGELAFAANVSAPSASAHLAKLVEGGLLTAEAQGRHRYYSLANAEAARLLESVASFSAAVRPRTPRPPALVRTMPSQFLHARTCYDHLAGEVAVQITQALLKSRWLMADGPDFKATRSGQRALTGLGVDCVHACSTRRAFARSCVDLTQRRPHVSGALGASLLALYVSEAWVLRRAGSRVVSITPKGAAAFKRIWGVGGLAS
jgi:DNA-binding transcriptional ArsR family regulator